MKTSKNIILFLSFLVFSLFAVSLVLHAIWVEPVLTLPTAFTGGMGVQYGFGLLLFNWASITHEDGRSDIPGVEEIGYWIPKADIESWPAVSATPTSAREEILLAGDFTLKSGKFWHKLYGTQGKGKVDFEPQGETDNGSVLNKLSFRHPTLRDEMLAFAKAALNADIVYIIKEVGNPERIVIGNEEFRTKTKTSGGTGDQTTGEKGCTVEADVTDTIPLPRYEGVIALDGETEPATS